MHRRPRDPSHSSSSSDEDDSGAPESVSLSQSKRQIRERESAVQKAQLSLTEKEREKRRAVDKKLKERAESNKDMKRKLFWQEVAILEDDNEDDHEDGSDNDDHEMEGPGEDEDDKDSDGTDEEGSNYSADDDADLGETDKELEARMLRAMRDAEDEDEFAREDEDHGDDNDEDIDIDDVAEANSNHLPDSLFQAAFQKSTKTPSSKPKTSSRPARKRRTRKDPKDLVLGTRNIRVLSTNANHPTTPRTTPSSKVSKFLDRSLALKGKAAKPKLGWERRPANIGLLKTVNGPAANFVRRQT